MTESIANAIAHNTHFILETIVIWVLVAFSHVIGGVIETPLIVNILPYVQLVALLLASTASAFTIYKIKLDLEKRK